MTALRVGQQRRPSTIGTALDILRVVATRGTGVTAKEIATALHLPPATAYRLLNQLVAEEYLVRTADLRGFGLGARLAEFIDAASLPPIPRAGREQLTQLRAAVRFAVHVVRYRSGSVQLLDPDPDHPVEAERDLARHLHASAAGKLFLASLPAWKSALPPTPLHKVTPATVTNLVSLEEELRAVRERDYAVESEQLEPGRIQLAVPIHDVDGSLAAALCVSGPTSRADAVLDTVDVTRHFGRRLTPLLT